MSKQYEQYKGSGIDWIGLYPNTWNLVRLRYLCDITTGSRDTIHREDDGEYPFYVRSKTIERISTYSFDGEAILTAGDGDICKIWHHVNEKFDFHQRVYMLYNFRKIVGRFLYYFISENFYYDVFKLSAKNTVDSLRLPMFHNFPVLVPSIQEQTQIALYLDYQTNIIDQLISKKQKLIELLKEKRQAIINEAVTKGLNPNAKMKDSGIEWLGEVPEEWSVSYLKRFCVKITDGAHFSPQTEFEGRNYISVKDVNEFGEIDLVNCKKISEVAFQELVKNGCQPNYGDVLLTKDGTIGRAAVVSKSNDFVALSSLGIITPSKSKLNSEYLRFYLISEINVNQMFSLIAGAALTRLTIDKMKHIIIPLPSLKEQIDIVDYLKKIVKQFDYILACTNKQIEKLKEYRQSIISEAVTGKIDVRDWQLSAS